MAPKRKSQAATAPKQPSSSASIIIPSELYLGPSSSASSTQFLNYNSVNHVLSIGRTPSHKVANITYHRLPVNDDTSALMLPTIDAAIGIIEASLKSKRGRGRILVHCVAGVSRSPTVVVGYLMKQRGMTLREALGHVIQTRPQVLPNAGFLAQLKTLEIELHGVSTLDLDELPRREADRLALFSAVDASSSSI